MINIMIYIIITINIIMLIGAIIYAVKYSKAKKQQVHINILKSIQKKMYIFIILYGLTSLATMMLKEYQEKKETKQEKIEQAKVEQERIEREKIEQLPSIDKQYGNVINWYFDFDASGYTMSIEELIMIRTIQSLAYYAITDKNILCTYEVDVELSCNQELKKESFYNEDIKKDIEYYYDNDNYEYFYFDNETMRIISLNETDFMKYNVFEDYKIKEKTISKKEILNIFTASIDLQQYDILSENIAILTNKKVNKVNYDLYKLIKAYNP